MEKKLQSKDAAKQSDAIDTSRRNLLGNAGKAVWVAPTLTLLSFTANADEPPPPPSDPLGGAPGSDQGTTSNRVKPRTRQKTKPRTKPRG